MRGYMTFNTIFLSQITIFEVEKNSQFDNMEAF